MYYQNTFAYKSILLHIITCNITSISVINGLLAANICKLKSFSFACHLSYYSKQKCCTNKDIWHLPFFYFHTLHFQSFKPLIHLKGVIFFSFSLNGWCWWLSNLSLTFLDLPGNKNLHLQMTSAFYWLPHLWSQWLSGVIAHFHFSHI